MSSLNKEALVIDYEDGVSRFVGQKELYESFLKKFPADPNYSDLCEAMALCDVPSAFSAAHTLKGVSGNLSLKKLYLSLLPFVDALRGEGNLNLARSLFPAVKEAYSEAVAAVVALG